MKNLAWIVGLLFLLAAAVVGLWLRADRETDVVNRAAAPASQTIEGGQGGTFPPPPADTRPELAREGRVVELCGHGRIVEPPTGYPYPREIEAKARRTLSEIAHEMTRSDDAASRAIGTYYQSLTLRSTDFADFLARNPGCETDPACRQRFAALGRASIVEGASRLATAAATTRDATAYALAWHLCGRAHATLAWTGPCAHVTAARWGEIEPDNVRPWMIEANRAARGGDAVALEMAMSRAAVATTANSHTFDLYRMASHPRLLEIDPATELVALAELVGIVTSFPWTPATTVAQRCRGDQAMRAEQRHQCLAIAAALANGATHMDAAMAAAMGKELGWTDAQVVAIRKRSSAIYAANHLRAAPHDIYSCDYLGATKQRLPELARLGEIGAGELAIQRSGKTIEALVEEFRTGASWAPPRVATRQ